MSKWESLPCNFADFNGILETNIGRFRKLIKLYEEYSEIQIKFSTKLSGNVNENMD